MRKLFIPLFSLLLLACAGDIPVAESTVALGNPDPMAQACHSGFNRVQPHFCASNSVVLITLSKNTCATFQPSLEWGIPTTTTSLILQLDSFIFSQNVLNYVDSNFVAFSAALPCTYPEPSYLAHYAKEFSPMVNTVISRITNQIFVKVYNDTIYYVYQPFGGTGSHVDVGLIGYYD